MLEVRGDKVGWLAAYEKNGERRHTRHDTSAFAFGFSY
jgi:hypothetical protein